MLQYRYPFRLKLLQPVFMDIRLIFMEQRRKVRSDVVIYGFLAQGTPVAFLVRWPLLIFANLRPQVPLLFVPQILQRNLEQPEVQIVHG